MMHHFQNVHKDVTNWDCEQCHKTLTNSAELIKHFDEEHIRGEYLCSVEGCEHMAFTRHDAHYHFDTHHQRSSGRLVDGVTIRPEAIRRSLDFDGHQYQSSINLKNNQYKYQIVETKCFKKSCLYFSGNLEKLHQHEEEIHNILPYQCAAWHCEQTFKEL